MVINRVSPAMITYRNMPNSPKKSDDAGAKKVFERLHLLSVAIFVSQVSASLYLIISEAYFV